MKGYFRESSRWAGIAALATALAACGGSKGDLENWVAEVRAKPAPPLDPLPVMQQFETFEYDAQNLRDPFSEMFNGGEGSGPRPDAGRRKQTLEQFPLDSFDMVGTLGNGKNLVALVMAPDKVTYRVQPGAYLGQSDGRVTAINEDRVELVELVPDGAGGWLERPATILLEDN
ncbi:pilus assembly protein PilP [Thermomonas carbonis]